jgi:hypothetical protein
VVLRAVGAAAVGRVGTFHVTLFCRHFSPYVILQCKHVSILMTASMVHVTNLTPRSDATTLAAGMAAVRGHVMVQRAASSARAAAAAATIDGGGGVAASAAAAAAASAAASADATATALEVGLYKSNEFDL